MTLADKIFLELSQLEGLSDRQLSVAIFGTRHRSTQINGECRYLEGRGLIRRRTRDGAPIGNFLVRNKPNFSIV